MPDPHTTDRLAELDRDLAAERALLEKAPIKSRDWHCSQRRIRALESVRAELETQKGAA